MKAKFLKNLMMCYILVDGEKFVFRVIYMSEFSLGRLSKEDGLQKSHTKSIFWIII